MDDSALRNYFLRPSCPGQRQYEALRAVFVEGVSQKDAAGRFGYSYGALRQLVLQFRGAFEEGSAPPFSTRTQQAAPASSRKDRCVPTSRPSPTSDA
jgi:transposase